MILLEIESVVIRQLLERSLDKNERLSSEYKCCDFDGVEYYIKFNREKKKKGEDEEAGGPCTVEIHMSLPCTNQISEFGAKEYYDKIYGKFQIGPIEKYTHAIKFNLQELNPEEQKAVITLACRLKANVLGAPLMWVTKLYQAKQKFAPFEIPYRAHTGESIYICPTEGGVVAVFTVRFKDPGDRVVGGVFLSELIAARTKVPSAPTISVSDKKPSDLDQFDIPQYIIDSKEFSFVSIVLGTPQLSDRKIDDIAYNLPLFRDYIHYHIKCTKGYLHSKMRTRVNAMLKILDAAKPEPKVKVQRTVTGKIVNR